MVTIFSKKTKKTLFLSLSFYKTKYHINHLLSITQMNKYQQLLQTSISEFFKPKLLNCKASF